MRTSQRWSIVRTATVLALVPSAVAAQARYAPDAPGRWKPWSIQVDNHAYGPLRFTTAEVRALESQMLGLNAILKAARGVATPVGFSAETSGSVTSTDVARGQPDPRKLPLPSSMLFGAFGITEYTRGGKIRRDDGGETAHLIFRINTMPKGDPVPAFVNLETDAMLEPRRGADVYGMPRYGEQLVLQKKDVPLFTPVTRDEAMRLTVQALEYRVGEARAALATLTQALTDWRNPQKQAQRMADYRLSASLSKDPTFIAKMTAFEKVNDAQLAAAAGPDGVAGRNVAVAMQAVAVANAAIAAVPQSERGAPSCFRSERGAIWESVDHIRQAPARDCVPIVRPNWSLFSAALPRTAPQLLVIDRAVSCLENPVPDVPGNCAANNALIETLDVAAVRGWLR